MSFLFENPYFVHPTARPHYGNRYPRYKAEDDMYGSPFGPSFSQPAYGRPSHHDRQQRAYVQAMRVREQAELDQRRRAEFEQAQRQREEFEQAQRQCYLEQLLKHMSPHSAHMNAHVDMPPEDHPTPMDVAPDTPASTPAAKEATQPMHTTNHQTQSKLRNPRPTKAERRRRRQAAATIQRWWRGVQAQRDTAMPDPTAATTGADRRDAAARVITRAVRKVATQKTTARALGQIQKLSGIVAEADALRAEFYDKVFRQPVHDLRGKVRYALLGYVDTLEKLILRTDDIPTYGQVRVRQQRKATVRHIQSLLEEADRYRQGGPQPAA